MEWENVFLRCFYKGEKKSNYQSINQSINLYLYSAKSHQKTFQSALHLKENRAPNCPLQEAEQKHTTVATKNSLYLLREKSLEKMT